MNDLLTLTGLSIVFVTWVFILLPFIHYKRRYKLNLISDTTTIPKIGYITDSSMALAGILSLIFVIALSKYATSWNLGLALMFMAGMSLVVSAILNKDRATNFHRIFGTIYFSLSVLGAFIFGFSLRNYTPNNFWIMQFLTFTAAFGSLIFYYRKRELLTQYWVVIFSNLWILVVIFSL